MSKKDLFKKQNPNKFISSANYDKLKEEVESKDFIKEKIKTDKTFTPKVDFSKAENFARYGLAEEYYLRSIENVYKNYPYDGSLYEREDWYNRGTYLDQYIFENLYPRTNGYVVLGDGWGTLDGTVGDYSLSTQREYIGFTGGPHLGYDPAGERAKSKANLFKAAKNRENNLKLDLEDGVTVEFWLKKGAFDNTLTKKEVLFDLWNNNLSSSADYGRLTIELSASAVSSDHVFLATCQSGTVGYFQEEIGNLTTAAIADDNWHHYAVSFASASGGINTKFYRDGQYVEEKVLGTAFSDATAAKMSANIGALVNAPSGNVYHNQNMLGYGKVLSSSFDEFRYWKTERNAKQIFQNYNNQVGGGTNTDDANTLLGVYFKFNEGVTGTDTDATVLDYSGRVSNGSWTGYEAGDRNVGSAMVSASAVNSEFKDPIIYSFHPDVATLKNNLQVSGALHDGQNISNLYSSIPSWIIEEDESYGGENLRHLTQIMASYLDTLHLQIEEVAKVKHVEYTSGSVKPARYNSYLISEKGVLSPDLLVDSDFLEALYNRNESAVFEKDLIDIKNKIYENLYNNLTHILKSKGAFSAFRNILNSLGVSEKLVNINLYSKNQSYEILDNTKLIPEAKKKVDFFNTSHNEATIHQFSSSAGDGFSYISGSAGNEFDYTPFTLESVFTTPKDNLNSKNVFLDNSILSCSLLGFHEVDPTKLNDDYTWASPDENNLKAYVVRTDSFQKDGYFLLTGSVNGTDFSLTSNNIKNVFDGVDWNVSVRFKHVNYPLTSRVSGAFDLDANSYLLDFSGYEIKNGQITNAFTKTKNFNKASGKALANSHKRVYAGAHLQNFTGSVLEKTFVKLSSVGFWRNYLEDQDLHNHLKDQKSYGIKNSNRPAYLLDDNHEKYVTNLDTLVLRWDFENLTASDASGQFEVTDLGRYRGDEDNVRYHYGQGRGFTVSSPDVLKSETVNSFKLAPVESVASSDMIEIRNDDEQIFLPDLRPVENYFAIEKSFYSAINERILEGISTLKDLNNVIGESANRYRPEYKELRKYAQKFFGKITNDLDFERFLEYYKWIDTSINQVASSIIPASADFSAELWNVIESHMLERNKIQHRLPVVKPMTTYEATINILPNSYKFSNKGKISLNLQNANQITASSFLTGSINVSGSGQEYLSIIENIYDLTTRNLSYKTYIQGDDNINTVGADRLPLKFRKPANTTAQINSVCINGIDGNSDYFLDSFAAVVTTTDSLQVSGVVDYTLPDRPLQEEVIVQRFSAPGGYEVNSLGYLDFGTTQYSVYNNHNFRNLIVRKALEEIRQEQDSDPTLLLDQSTGNYFHGVYRNPKTLTYHNGVEVIDIREETEYDNAFVQYSLPPSDLQYSWINKSYSSANFKLRQNGQTDIEFKPESFYSWAMNPPQGNDYGITINTSSNLMSASPETPSASNNYISSIGKYNFSSWEQVRNSSPILAKFRKENILSVANPSKQDTYEGVDNKTRTSKETRPSTFTNYYEPVVTRKFKPIKTTLVLDNAASDVVVINSDHASRYSFFANKDLNVLFGKDLCKIVSGYDKVKKLYLDTDQENSSIKGWLSVEYGEAVWPKQKFEGMNSHRSRPSYESTADELLNNLCQYRSIWKDTAANRKRSTTLCDPFTAAGNSLGVLDPFCVNIFPLSDYSSANGAGEYPYINVVTDAGLKLNFDTADVLYLEDPTGEAPLVPPVIGTSVFSFSGSATYAASSFDSFFVGSDTYDGLHYLAAAINRHPTASLYYRADLPNVSASSGEQVVRIYGAYQGAASCFEVYNVSGSAVFLRNSDGESLSIEKSPIAWDSEGSAPEPNRDGELNSSFLSVNGYREQGLFGGAPRLLTNDNVGSSITSGALCNPYESYYYPKAAQTFVHRPKPSVNNVSGEDVVPYNGHPWRTAQSSSRNPFFNSFEEYIQNPRFLTDDYSIIPEFTFSDHVDYYYNQKAGDLRAVNKKLLEIEGALNATSSADTEASSYNAAFHKDYAYTEYLQKFDNVVTDHQSVGEIGEVTLTCKGIKKFLPKQGFYPVSRATQLGTLFKDTIGTNLTGISDIVSTHSSSAGGIIERTFEGSAENARLQAALQPLFSPGVLYNTIKSGIAVDWPIIFSGSLTTGSLASTTLVVPNSTATVASDASKRVPFDAFYNLDLFPRGEDVLYLYPSWHSASNTCDRFPFFNWNGKKSSELYEKAASNFLAEVQNFFLNNRRNIDILSNSEKNFKSFESGKTYYMDVALKQTSNHFMWKDYFDGTKADNLGEVGSYNGRAFGPGWNKTGDTTQNEVEIGRDPSYAPYTPPYFYGESLARISFTPDSSKKYTLDDILASASVEYLNADLLADSAATAKAYTNRMSLDSSVNLFEKLVKSDLAITTNDLNLANLAQTVDFDSSNLTQTLGGDTTFEISPATSTSENSAWRISPKFECPTLNFYNQPSEQYYSRGMWGGLGEIPSGSEGVFLRVQESFTGSFAATTGSLIDQLGFDITSYRVGEIANKTVIKEAIVAIPFLERERKNNEEAELTNIDNRNFFKIDKDLINAQLREGKDTTLTRMHHKMKDYVIPPNYNFAKYGDIDPFVMYIFEFDMEFDKQDLAYMWQGVMPDPSLNGNEEFESVTIKHKTGKDEFYHGKQIPTDIRWLVFKVKQKAKKDYEKVVKLQAQDDEEYGYNWPYDYCSVVELAKVEASFKITPKKSLEELGIKLGLKT